MKQQPPSGRSSSWVALLEVLLALLKALLGQKKSSGSVSSTSPSPSPSRTPARSAPPKSSPRSSSTSDGQISQLFRDRQSDTIVTSSGVVVKVLRDDLDDSDGSGVHQQFLVEVDDVTIKISHNLKFGRAPIREGDTVRFKGEYEWNDRGGCVHWTHHDPKGWHEDGWLEHNGQQYG